jgi:hypothetical protein
MFALNADFFARVLISHGFTIDLNENGAHAMMIGLAILTVLIFVAISAVKSSQH